MLGLYGQSEVGRGFLGQLRGLQSDGVVVKSFGLVRDDIFHNDGRVVTEILGGISGSIKLDVRDSPGSRIIYINRYQSNLAAALTLYHEAQHMLLGVGEEAARRMTEEFAIGMGWPETGAGYRSNGQVNQAVIDAAVGSSTHYNVPSTVDRTDRRYASGELRPWGDF